ncbi:hypothetical protein ACFQH6_11305 [Halobacteriaceae archaeon GCM10025711]
MGPRPAVLLVALLVALAMVSAASAAAGPSSVADTQHATGTSVPATADRTIVRTTTLSLTPDQPGSVDVTVDFDVPSNVKTVEIELPLAADVDTRNGFTRVEDHRYKWERGEGAPALTFVLPANRTSPGRRTFADAPDGSGYTFADPGPWAIVPVPSLYTRWVWAGGGTVSLDKHVAVDGEGITGGDIAYLGAYESANRTVAGQTLTLVVPEAASMHDSPETVLSSLAFAAERFDVGGRDDEVLAIAAPTGTVDWGVGGVQYGAADFWVRDTSPVASPDNIWLHEYVHTRQTFRGHTTIRTEWLSEATAEYYAALLTLQHGDIDYDAFRSHLSLGSDRPYADAVLADPFTWHAAADYYKGALVYAALDREVRTATGTRHTAAEVFARLNDRNGTITNREFLATVTAVGGEESKQFAERFIATEAAPSLWSQSDHQTAFSTLPAHMEYSMTGDESPPRMQIAGPYRNRTVLGQPPTLVVGERLTVDAVVENTGGEDGEYRASLAVEDAVVDTATGDLGAGNQTRAPLSHTFVAPGIYEVAVGSEVVLVTVRDPADATVVSASASNATVAPGDPVTVTARVYNLADVPADTQFTFAVDGHPVATERVRLDHGEASTLSVTTEFDTPGVHTVTVGERTVTVSVGTETTTPAGQTGFGTLAAVVALALVAFALRRHE